MEHLGSGILRHRLLSELMAELDGLDFHHRPLKH